MFFRVSGWVILLFWAASMTWLIRHDVWPALTAGEPPQVAPNRAGISGIQVFQVGIFNEYDHRIGTAWTTYAPPRLREDVLYLSGFLLPGPILLEIDSTFTGSGELDEFKLTARGPGIPLPTDGIHPPIEVRGERFASVYGFTLVAGGLEESFKISAAEAGLIGDVFRPFASLPGLEVGQSWRMQVVNPVSVVTGVGRRFVPMLVRVTGRETILTPGGEELSCLVVEAPNVTAWVDDEGLVWVQRVRLPIGGELTVRNEPYDEKARRNAMAAFRPGGHGGRRSVQ